MSILVINSGSTSVKYKLFADDETEIRAGVEENIKDHNAAMKNILRQIGDLRDLAAVGHRVVHGGGKFFKPLVINQRSLAELEKFNELAPLHNPFNLAGVKAAAEYLPQAEQLAVFDTAFYHDLPQAAKNYALPAELAEKYHLRRYGFHGISHKFALEESAKLLKKAAAKINLISCHLGGGCSATAVKNGRPVDTSMGLTPLEGLVMMTRPGDLDAGVIFKLLKDMPGEINREKTDRLYDILNRQSGIKGLAGLADFQKFLARVSLGEEASGLAFDLFISRLVKYIGAYWTLLEGRVNAIVFTGAIGSGNPMTRNAVMEKIKCLGKLPMLVIKTNEELLIMREVKAILSLQ